MTLLRLMMYSYLLIPYQKLFKDIHLYCKTRLFLKGIIKKFVSGLATYNPLWPSIFVAIRCLLLTIKFIKDSQRFLSLIIIFIL